MAAQFVESKPSEETNNVLWVGLAGILSPQKVYLLGLRQIVTGPPPGDDLFAGWQYQVGIGPDIAIAALIGQQPDENRPSFLGLAGGPQIAKAVRAAEQLERRTPLPDGTYEKRLLHIPGLLTDCFWLRSTTGGEDHVVPFDTVVHDVTENRVYTMDRFLAILQPLAIERLAHTPPVYKQNPDDPDRPVGF